MYLIYRTKSTLTWGNAALNSNNGSPKTKAVKMDFMHPNVDILSIVVHAAPMLMVCGARGRRAPEGDVHPRESSWFQMTRPCGDRLQHLIDDLTKNVTS